VIALKAFSTAQDVAYFNVAYMLSQPLGFVSSALSMAAFPLLARYAQQNPESLRLALRKTSKYQLLVTLPAMVGLFLLAERLIPLLFHGTDFGKAGMALKIMSLGLTFIFLNLMSRYVLAALDRQQTYLRAIVVGLAVNVILCFVLIPRFGFVGACLAYLGAEAAIFVVCQNAMARYVAWLDLAKDAVRPAVAALGMGLVVSALQDMNPFLVMAFGATTYGALLLALRALSPQELSILKGVYVSFRLPGSTQLARAGRRNVTAV
jgi:O-antigen/teichoic acid export membrane protein